MSSDELITYFKIFGLQWHLGLDIWCDEDVFEIHPFALCLHPLFNDVHYELDILAEFLGARLYGLDVAIGQGIVYISQ